MAGKLKDYIGGGPVQQIAQAMHMPLRPFHPGEKVNNPDGSYSTERTVTVQAPDGSWVVAPSLWMGPNGPADLRQFGDDYIGKIAQMYERQTGQLFPRFKSIAEADAWAKSRSAGGGASNVPLVNVKP